jgi:hypothetical protein
VVQIEQRDTADDRRCDDVRSVETPPQPCLEEKDVDVRLGENSEADQGQEEKNLGTGGTPSGASASVA